MTSRSQTRQRQQQVAQQDPSRPAFVDPGEYQTLYQGDRLFGCCCRWGTGTEFYGEGHIYQGEWRMDLRHGQGTFWYEDGDRYEGAFRNGYPADGTFFFAASGQKYVGQYDSSRPGSLRHGWGVFHYASGERYEGEYKNGTQSGQGSFHHADGTVEVGPWLEGSPIGKHVATLPDGSTKTHRYHRGRAAHVEEGQPASV